MDKETLDQLASIWGRTYAAMLARNEEGRAELKAADACNEFLEFIERKKRGM